MSIEKLQNKANRNMLLAERLRAELKRLMDEEGRAHQALLTGKEEKSVELAAAYGALIQSRKAKEEELRVATLYAHDFMLRLAALNITEMLGDMPLPDTKLNNLILELRRIVREGQAASPDLY